MRSLYCSRTTQGPGCYFILDDGRITFVKESEMESSPLTPSQIALHTNRIAPMALGKYSIDALHQFLAGYSPVINS